MPFLPAFAGEGGARVPQQPFLREEEEEEEDEEEEEEEEERSSFSAWRFRLILFRSAITSSRALIFDDSSPLAPPPTASTFLCLFISCFGPSIPAYWFLRFRSLTSSSSPPPAPAPAAAPAPLLSPLFLRLWEALPVPSLLRPRLCV